MGNTHIIIIDKTALPKNNYGHVDWKNCRNIYLPFICNDDIHGKLYIEGPESNSNIMFNVEFNGHKATIHRERIMAGEFINLVINSRLTQKYSLGDIIDSHIKDHKFKIINYGVRTQNGKEEIFYECKCLNCGGTYKAVQHNLKWTTCHHCYESNTIPKYAPWMIDYFQGGYDEAIQYQCTSHDRIFPVCPKCGEISSKPIKIISLYTRGMSCSCSNNGMSFPEKILYSLLEQLNIDFVFQASTAYLKFNSDSLRIYDFYLPQYSMIIETHGMQHYKNIKNWNNSDNQNENDIYKKQIAKDNGIDKYIEIDCRYSKIKWIKNAIMNSILPQILNFKEDDINWKICSDYKYKDLIKRICEDYNNNYFTTSELAEKYHISTGAVNRYLNIGDSKNWCIHRKNINTKRIPIEVVDKNNKHIRYFKSINDAYLNSNETIGVTSSSYGIKKSIENKIPYKGFTYKIVEDIPLRWKILTDEII